MRFRLSTMKLFDQELDHFNRDKALISTINAHSYNIAHYDKDFRVALKNSDVLLPDGISVVLARNLFKTNSRKRIKKIAGADLFRWEMERMNKIGGKSFFLGSNEKTLAQIEERAAIDYPNVEIKTFSPPYKDEFTAEESAEMIEAVNSFAPEVLFIGMTAPKQEKWAYQHYDQLQAGHVCCIGAVFDFYVNTVKRAPKIMIHMGLEWLFRLTMEPKRLWRRYLIGNAKFIYLITKEKLALK